MKHKMITILPGLSMLLFLPYQSLAEDIPYLPKVTKEELHRSLDPSGEPPPQSQPSKMRGLEPVKPETAAPIRRSCNFNEQGRERGVEKGGKTQEVKSVAFPVLFEFGKATLTPEAEKTLDIIADSLKEGKLASACFRIEGHTDNIGSAKSNLTLSDQRAQSAMRYLEQKGIEQWRLSAVGYGLSKPLTENDTPEGRQKNRRAQLANLGYAQ